MNKLLTASCIGEKEEACHDRTHELIRIWITEIKTEKDLLPPGAEPGTVPTDLEQATGLERLEILGKMQGIDIFDMSPLPSDRVGTLKTAPIRDDWRKERRGEERK